MTSLILRTATRYLLALLLLFSVFLLLRGHNHPGGGFAGGLVAAGAFALYSIAFDPGAARDLLRVDPRSLIGAGLLLALGSGLPALPAGQPFLTGQWTHLEFGRAAGLDLGTPLLFDLGVYLAVLGMTLTILLALAEE